MSRIGFYYKWKREQAKARVIAEDAIYNAYLQAITSNPDAVKADRERRANFAKEVKESLKAGEALKELLERKATAEAKAVTAEEKAKETDWVKERIADFQNVKKTVKIPVVITGNDYIANRNKEIAKAKAFHEKMITMEFKEIKRPRATKLIFSEKGLVINNAQIAFTFPEKAIIPEPVEIPQTPELQFPVVVVPNYPVVQATA